MRFENIRSNNSLRPSSYCLHYYIDIYIYIEIYSQVFAFIYEHVQVIFSICLPKDFACELKMQIHYATTSSTNALGKL